MSPTDKQEILLCTGVLATPAATLPWPLLDLVEFRMVASWMGFLIGLMSTAAGLSGLVLLRIGVENITTEMIFILTCCWSILVAVATWTIFFLIRRLIVLVLVDENVEALGALEGRCALWSIHGINLGYCIVDFFLLSTQKFLISIAILTTTIALSKAILMCSPSYHSPQPNVETLEHRVPLLAVV
jgi:hypothetical protein